MINNDDAIKGGCNTALFLATRRLIMNKNMKLDLLNEPQYFCELLDY